MRIGDFSTVDQSVALSCKPKRPWLSYRDFSFFLPAPLLCAVPLKVVFLVESSENISPPAFRRVKGFLKDVVRYLLTTAGERQVGVVLYNSEATKEIAFGRYNSEFGFNEAIDKLPHEKGQPRIDTALQLAAEMFATSGGMVFN